jgi:Ca2+-binding RTX toxin-like protein
MNSLRRRSFGIECLEHRTLMTADLVNGTLTVVGTTENDNIQVQVAVSGQHAGELQVDVNAQQSFFDPLQVNSIRISGLAGRDQITVDDNVTINAIIDGGANSDVIKGGAGNDTIHGGMGNDTIDGSVGNDAIFGDEGQDSIHGGDGDDTIHGNQGNDSMWGGDGEDSLWGDAGRDFIDGELGDDICRGGKNVDNVHGGAGNDQEFGDDNNDQVWGDDGNDYLNGGKGFDYLHGGLGDDELQGDNGRDWLDGDQGINLLDGGRGRDSLFNGIEASLDNEFRSLFTGSNSESGSAVYDLKNDGNVVETRFEVHIQSFAANAAVNVVVDNVVVGQINTDASGNGDLMFSTIPSGNDLAFPSGFPTLHLGSTILVGSTVQSTFVPWHPVA